MRVVRYLQHWLSGSGARLQVANFVPVMHPIRQWADTLPWGALGSAIEQSFEQRFPKISSRGRRPVPIRVLLALELLKHALGAADEDSCHRLRTDFAGMYACGLQDYQVNPSQAHFVLPETLGACRSRIDEALMDERIAIQAAAAMEEGRVSPARLASLPSRAHKEGSGSPMPPHCIKHKKTLALIDHIVTQCSHRPTPLQSQTRGRRQALAKVMRRFGRRCRGQGQVCVKLVRHPAPQLLALGEPIHPLALKAKERLDQPRTLREGQCQRLTLALTTARHHHAAIRPQATRLPHGKKLSHAKLVHAYAPTMTPIVKGKSNGPAQFGRKPGIASELATGFIFAPLVPQGNPSDPSYGRPLLERGQNALDRVQTGPRRQIHSVARDLSLHDPC